MARFFPIVCTRSCTGGSVVTLVAPLVTKLNFGTDAPQFVATIREMSEATPNSVPSWFGFRLGVCEGAPFAHSQVTRHLEDRRIAAYCSGNSDAPAGVSGSGVSRHRRFAELGFCE
jgi:hypothetical protein